MEQFPIPIRPGLRHTQPSEQTIPVEASPSISCSAHPLSHLPSNPEFVAESKKGKLVVVKWNAVAGGLGLSAVVTRML